MRDVMRRALDLLIKYWMLPAIGLVLIAAGSAIAIGVDQWTGRLSVDVIVILLTAWVLVVSIGKAVRTAIEPELPWAVIGAAYATLLGGSYLAIRLGAVTGLEVSVGEGFQWFAVLFILALAIERALEPLMQTKATAEEKKAEASEPTTANVKKSRVMIAFLLASVVGLLLSGLLGLGLIDAVAPASAEGEDADSWLRAFAGVDVVVTGLAIGAGTKPIHDLINAIQKKGGS